MTLTDTLTGLFTRSETAETADEQQVVAEVTMAEQNADTVDIFDVTHAGVDWDRLRINSAWWVETGRDELAEAVDDAEITRTELSRLIGYSDDYISSVMGTEHTPSVQAMENIQREMTVLGTESVWDNPAFDVLVEGATYADGVGVQ